LDNAIAYIARQGHNALISKIDIKSAFRLCPVCPDDRHLLGFSWDNKLYFDKVLAMGLASSCRIFETFSTAVKWIALKHIRKAYIAKILDDFLLVTDADHPCPDLAFSLLKTIFTHLGIPLAEEKCVPPCKCLVYLGLEIDILNMCIKLPVDKVHKCVESIMDLMGKKKTRVKQIHSLCGLLQFACRAVVPGRPFLRRLYDATIRVTNPKFYIRISREMKDDLSVWLNFLSNYNGRSMFLAHQLQTPRFTILSDASSSVGFGAICGDLWLYGVWTEQWKCHAITVLEFGPIIFGLATWALSFSNACIHVKTDNLALVSVINKQTSPDPSIMFLVRKMMELLLRHNILLSASHIDGRTNVKADALSRGHIDLFQALHPSAARLPSAIPRQWDPHTWAPPSPA
jgi:hypothetical protein